MKIYKLLLCVLLGSLAISCSQDSFEEPVIDDPNARIAAPGQFDNSHLGEYKGVFTTADGLIRGSVVITLSPKNEGIAQINLSSGEVIELKSHGVKMTVDNIVNNLRFTSLGLSSIDASFDFSVESNGTIPMVSNVSFDTKDSDILIAKSTSRLPATPITGTYDCTNCAAVGVGFPNGRTWNVMSVGIGNNQSYQVQISYGGRVYTSTGSQNGCFDLAGYTICGIAGTAQILGYGLTWNGTHAYDASSTQVCSSVVGNWSAPTYGPGITGTFTSDADCSSSTPVNDTCTNALTLSCDANVTGSTSNANNIDAPAATCGTSLNTAPGVWYSFSSSIAQVVTMDTNGSGYDTKLGVFTGSCGALVCVDGDDDGGDGTNSLVNFNATAGTTYYVYVTGFSTNSGTYSLNVACTPPPPPLTCGDTLVDNGGASGNYSNNSLDTYTIDAGAGNTISLQFSEFDTENTWDFLQVYDGADSSAPEITVSVGGNTILDYGGEEHGFTGTGVNSLNNDSVVSSGQFMTLVFYSDGSATRSGFLAEVVCLSGRAAYGSQKTSLNFDPPKIVNPRSSKGETVKLQSATERKGKQ